MILAVLSTTSLNGVVIEQTTKLLKNIKANFAGIDGQIFALSKSNGGKIVDSKSPLRDFRFVVEWKNNKIEPNCNCAQFLKFDTNLFAKFWEKAD